ncbi:MAG: dynamin family protein [Firmicutes bacterium]|nr:dynamin family protein [Bacillota bacterium]
MKRNVFIAYNPYKLETTVLIDGGPVAGDSGFSLGNQRLQEWVDHLPAMLWEECGVKEIDLTFHGTALDYDDVCFSAQLGIQEGMEISCSFQPGAEPHEKLGELGRLFERMKNLGFKELNEPNFSASIERLLGADFEVNIIAPVSAGKSTLINALLGKWLMPTSNEACTAIITKVRDKDREHFGAVAKDADGQVLETVDDLDRLTMDRLNDPQKTPWAAEILVEGKLPFLDSKGISMVLVDSPGTNNARDRSHQVKTLSEIDNSDKSLIVFVINATNTGVTDEAVLLRKIADKMKESGKLSRDRFIFVVNKMDQYISEPEKVRRSLLPNLLRDLEKIGIDDPCIFPVSAELALGARCGFSKEAGISRTVRTAAEELCESPLLHFEKAGEYVNAHISPREKDGILRLLARAEAQEDLCTKALVHSGMLNLEAAIRDFADKYARAQKLRDTAKKIRGAFDTAEAEAELKESLLSMDAHRIEIVARILALREKIETADRGRECKERIEKHHIQQKAEELVGTAAREVTEKISELGRHCNEKSHLEMWVEIGARHHNQWISLAAGLAGAFMKMRKERGINAGGPAAKNTLSHSELTYINTEFEVFSTATEAQLRSNFETIINDNIKSATEDLLSEYKASIQDLLPEQEIESLAFDPLVLMQGPFEGVRNVGSYITTSTYTTANPERQGKWGRFKFWKKKEISHTTTSSDWDKFYEDTFEAFNAHILDLKGEVVKCAEDNERAIKTNFEELYAKMDKILLAKLKELEALLCDEDALKKEIERIRVLLEEIRDLNERLDAILEL